MKHTILYHGRFELNFDRLHRLKDDFTIKRTEDKGLATVASPSDKVDGIVFGYMEKSKRRFFAVKVEDVILSKPVRLVPDLHTDGKGFGPAASQFGDQSAKRLLEGIIAQNPGQEDELGQIYESHFGAAGDLEK